VEQIISMATGMPVSKFSGGKAPGNANTFAADLGFKIVELRPGRNPTWVRDELILALDIYLRYAGSDAPATFPWDATGDRGRIADHLGSNGMPRRVSCLGNLFC